MKIEITHNPDEHFTDVSDIDVEASLNAYEQRAVELIQAAYPDAEVEFIRRSVIRTEIEISGGEAEQDYIRDLLTQAYADEASWVGM